MRDSIYVRFGLCTCSVFLLIMGMYFILDITQPGDLISKSHQAGAALLVLVVSLAVSGYLMLWVNFDLIFDRNMRAFTRNKKRLLKEFGEGVYLAYQNGRLLDHDSDRNLLLTRVRSAYPSGNIMVHQLLEKEPVLHL